MGKQRARKGRGGFYTPAETVAFQQVVQWSAKAAGVRESEGPIGLFISATYKPPKSWNKEDIKAAIETPWYKITKPDFDNIEKIISDGLNKIAYKDDAQVCVSSFEKFYGEEDSIEVTIQHLVN